MYLIGVVKTTGRVVWPAASPLSSEITDTMGLDADMVKQPRERKGKPPSAISLKGNGHALAVFSSAMTNTMCALSHSIFNTVPSSYT